MDVEAQHLNLFHPQIIRNRESMMKGVEGSGNVFHIPTVTETVVPMYGPAITVKTMEMKSETVHSTYGCIPVSRKRSIDAIDYPPFQSFNSGFQNRIENNCCGSFTFLGEDVSVQIQQQQLEIERFVAQHSEKMRIEIEEKRRRHNRRIASIFEENVIRRIRAKEEEILKIGKLNFDLEEKVRSLCSENQIWRDLAQSNEAAANVLRFNLEQVHSEQQLRQNHGGAGDTDAQSHCGSNYDEKVNCHTLIGESVALISGEFEFNSMNRVNDRCRNCGKDESCVLLLPCRHLCLCTVCGSSLHTCPICNCTKTASVHVNLSG